MCAALSAHPSVSSYTAEYNNLVETGLLPYDFHAVLNNGKEFLIEMDGLHHFEPVEFCGCPDKAEERFKSTQVNDKRKDELAEEHGLPLLRVPHFDAGDIPGTLDNFIKSEKRLVAEK